MQVSFYGSLISVIVLNIFHSLSLRRPFHLLSPTYLHSHYTSFSSCFLPLCLMVASSYSQSSSPFVLLGLLDLGELSFFFFPTSIWSQPSSMPSHLFSCFLPSLSLPPYTTTFHFFFNNSSSLSLLSYHTCIFYSYIPWSLSNPLPVSNSIPSFPLIPFLLSSIPFFFI